MTILTTLRFVEVGGSRPLDLPTARRDIRRALLLDLACFVALDASLGADVTPADRARWMHARMLVCSDVAAYRTLLAKPFEPAPLSTSIVPIAAPELHRTLVHGDEAEVIDALDAWIAEDQRRSHRA